jgi:hypothetical protein
MPAFAGLSNTKQSLIERADDPTVMATNIQTQIDKMKPLRQSYRDEYGHLCEFSHPNSLGAVVYFQTFGEEADVEIYSDCGPDPENDLKWVLVGGSILQHFDDAVTRIEAQLPGLSASLPFDRRLPSAQS